MKLPWNLRSKHPVLLVAGLGGFFTVVSLSSAQDWTIPSTPSLVDGWRSVACSADGMRLVAGGGPRVDWYDWHDPNESGVISPIDPGYYYPIFAPLWISKDAGTTWLDTGLSGYNVCWKAVASSADGTKLVAAMLNASWSWGPWGFGLHHGPGPIYSSFDSGKTWTATIAPSNYWASLASSADGVKLFAAAYGGEIFISSDSGATWHQSAVPSSVSSIACSADGLKLAAAVFGGPIFTSADSGASWTQTSAPTNQWLSVASSADGTRLVAAADGTYESSPTYVHWRGGRIYLSTDSGATWTPTSAPSNGWQSVACSADGTRLIATGTPYGDYGSGTTGTYISDNSGLVWTKTSSIWGASSVASSADGNMTFVAGDRVYRSVYNGLWKMGNAPAASWQALASSANGTKLVAAVYGGPIYTSVDSGATWAETTAPSNHWESIASSADGTKLIAAVRWTPGISNTSLGGPIYKSADAGASWTQTSAPTNYWAEVASSADGSKLVAAVWGTYGGSIYLSADSGATWTQTGAPSNHWASVASSADGTKLVAAAYINVDSSNNWRSGSIFISSDAGATWTQTSAPSNRWGSVASSADGTKLVAQAYSGPDDPWPYGRIYLSADSGTTWTEADLPTNYWASASSSADGRTLVAVGYYLLDYYSWFVQYHIYVSNDSGLTWNEAAAPSESWRAVVCSGDGNRLIAAADNGPIYTLQLPIQPPPPPPTRRLDIQPVADQLQLSWVIPSSPFVLQESADLQTANWMDVPTSPTLNLTNLHHEVTLASPAGNRFYRLKQR